MVDIAAALPAARRNRFGVSLPLVFGVVAYIAAVGWGRRVLGDPDTFWHIAVGHWIRAHHAAPHEGIFSYPMAHVPWVAHEWLSEALLATIYDHFGWSGLVVAAAGSAALAIALLLRLLLCWLEPAHAMLATALGWDLAFFHVAARPHVFTLPLLVFWVGQLAVAREKEQAPPLWLAPLLLLWANLHASWALALGLAGLLGAEAVVLAADWPARWRAVRGWGLFCLVGFVAVCITPYGLDGLLLPFRLTSMTVAMQVVAEWRSPNFQPFHPLELWIALVFAGGLSLGWRLPWPRALIVMVLLHMTLQHQRYIDVLGLVSPLLMAPAIGRQLAALMAGRAVSAVDRGALELSKPATPAGFGIGAAALLVASLFLLRHGEAPPDGAGGFSPNAALAAVAAAHVPGPVLNDYDFGGYLIFRGMPPMIDGRNELYGDAYIKRYTQATQVLSDALPGLLDEYHVGWTLLEPRSPAVVLLDHLQGWHRLYTSEMAVVHVRDQTK